MAIWPEAGDPTQMVEKAQVGFIDYINPDAMNWWHGLQQQGARLGRGRLETRRLRHVSFPAGSPVSPSLSKRTHAGWMTTRQYMDRYCRDELANGLTHNSNFVILARFHGPFLEPPPKAFHHWDAATVTWVGDKSPHLEREGPRAGSRHQVTFSAGAKLGYCVVWQRTRRRLPWPKQSGRYRPCYRRLVGLMETEKMHQQRRPVRAHLPQVDEIAPKHLYPLGTVLRVLRTIP